MQATETMVREAEAAWGSAMFEIDLQKIRCCARGMEASAKRLGSCAERAGAVLSSFEGTNDAAAEVKKALRASLEALGKTKGQVLTGAAVLEDCVRTYEAAEQRLTRTGEAPAREREPVRQTVSLRRTEQLVRRLGRIEL